MRFYNQVHRFYCGIDLHARTMHLCILDHDGHTDFDKNLPCNPRAFLHALEPFRDGLIVGVECMFGWYWLADLCQEHGIAFVIGHALYMRAIHGGKAKNDRLDAGKIARLLRGGTFPLAYVYPRGMRESGTYWLETRNVRPLPAGYPRVEPLSNWDRSPDREPAVLTSRRGERTIFLGASQSACRWSAQALGSPALTLHSCWVQPSWLQPVREKSDAVARGEVNSFCEIHANEEKNLQNSGVRLLTLSP